MRPLRMLALAAVAALPLAARAEAPPAAKVDPAARDAVAAAEAWLALLDGERYGASWDEASALFRGAVAKERWVAQAGAVRAKLGKVTARVLDGAVARKVEGADAWTISWTSRLERLPEATETVTVMKDDGRWRCAGYFVKRRG